MCPCFLVQVLSPQKNTQEGGGRGVSEMLWNSDNPVSVRN